MSRFLALAPLVCVLALGGCAGVGPTNSPGLTSFDKQDPQPAEDVMIRFINAGLASNSAAMLNFSSQSAIDAAGGETALLKQYQMVAIPLLASLKGDHIDRTGTSVTVPDAQDVSAWRFNRTFVSEDGLRRVSLEFDVVREKDKLLVSHFGPQS